ncbi:hypothetical protein [Isoalcanivorax pacificus]|uniref:hypothetical protein n=1 Tax=Isoalcanivorax pacificus TaxID=1306787 RepID=UPI001184A673|nr:hypothetical protein [Isoalcanivorax pacificus]
MNSSDQNNRHVEAEEFSNAPASENPLGGSFNITVSVPDKIKIKMVDASILEDYEIWLFIASLFSSAVVGFLVAYFQAIDSKSASITYIGWTTTVFGVLFALSVIVAIRKRSALRKKGRDIELKTSSAKVKGS